MRQEFPNALPACCARSCDRGTRCLSAIACMHPCRALTEEYLAILELRAAEVQQLAERSLSEQQYRQWRQEQHQQPAAPGVQ